MGASGFAGAELLRRLLSHPHFEILRVCATDHVGMPVSSAHPHLEGLSELRFENPPIESAIAGADVVLMGLPHDVSVKLVRAVQDPKVRILDLSGAFRLRDLVHYQRFYGEAHPAPELLPDFVYGLPELNRDKIRGASRLASPGCFATTIQLSLLPLAKAGWLSGTVSTVAATGSSGSGANASPGTHHPVRAQNLKTYRPLLHQHAPEIVRTLTDAGARDLSLDFVPISAPLTRGIFATSLVDIPGKITEVELTRCYAEAFSNEPFVRIPKQRLPEVVAVSHSNYAEVGFTWGELRGNLRRIAVFGALDNLIKGGAGQAIQNLNLMFGLDERLTLMDPGGYP